MTRDERQKKYDDLHTIRISLKLNLDTDVDILNQIDVHNKQKSIKELLRDGIKYRTTPSTTPNK